MDIMLLVLYSVLSGLVLVSNGIVVVVVAKSRQLHLPTLWNIAFMAAWDFALGLYFLVLAVPSIITNEFAYSEKMKMPSAVILMFIIDQNILNVVVALVDRYISISWPLRYTRLMSSRRFSLAVVAVFSFNLSRVLLVVLTNHTVRYYPGIGVCISTNEVIAKLSSFALICIACCFIVVLLVAVAVKMCKLRRAFPMSGGRAGSTQFTLTICLSTVVFIACFMPIGLVVIYSLSVGGGEKVPKILVQFALTSVLSNSLWNVYIYTFTYKPFKDAFLRLFFPTLSRERARRKIQLEYEQSRNQVFKMCDSVQ